MWRSFDVICRREIENKIKENINNVFNVSGFIRYSITRTEEYSVFNFDLEDIYMDFENCDTIDSEVCEFFTKFFGDIFPEEVFILNERTVYYNSQGDEEGHEEGSIYLGRNLIFFCESINLYSYYDDITEKERENITAGSYD